MFVRCNIFHCNASNRDLYTLSATATGGGGHRGLRIVHGSDAAMGGVAERHGCNSQQKE
jgi:hypothetical protein